LGLHLIVNFLVIAGGGGGGLAAVRLQIEMEVQVVLVAAHTGLFGIAGLGTANQGFAGGARFFGDGSHLITSGGGGGGAGGAGTIIQMQAGVMVVLELRMI
jgi:hypothetical protein